MVKPSKITRPGLAAWMWERGLKPRDRSVQAALSKTYESIRLYCLPFGDPKRVIPDEETLRRIIEWTDREVTAADFYPPDLREANVDILRLARAQ